MTSADPLVRISDVTVRIRDKMVFRETDWEIGPGENWTVLGPNGAGKSTLVRLLVGDIPYSQGTITRTPPELKLGYVSFELQDWVLNTEEIRRDERDRKGRGGREKAHEALLLGNEGLGSDSPLFTQTTGLMKIGHLLGREVRRLSTGEIRKVLIARALLKSPRLLILDEPLSGIDAASRAELAAMINALPASGTQLVLVTNRPEEVLPCVTHALFVRDCRILFRGTKPEALKRLGLLYETRDNGDGIHNFTAGTHSGTDAAALVEMKNVTVRYGRKKVLEKVNWTVRAGEKWAVTGPNGSGKTTLLKLITGENLQVYSNRVRVFGARRGTGELLNELRGKIGSVSSEQLTGYRKNASGADVIASGFFESIGLYRNITVAQKERVRELAGIMGIAPLLDKPFGQTSYGEKRLLMIARALVKSPPLLIMDEPCEGLDPANRNMVLGIIDSICRQTSTTLIYVTHYPDELPGGITHRLELPGENVPYPRS